MQNTNAKLIIDNIATILTLFPNDFIEPMSGKYDKITRNVATSFAHIRTQHVTIQDNFKRFDDEKYIYVTSSTTQYGGENYVSFRRDIFAQWMQNNKLPYVLWLIKGTNEYQLITPEQLKEVANEKYNREEYIVQGVKYYAFRMKAENNKRRADKCPKNTMFNPTFAKSFYKIMPTNYANHRNVRGVLYFTTFDSKGEAMMTKECRSIKELYEMAAASGFTVSYKTMTRRVNAGQLIDLGMAGVMGKAYIYASYDPNEDTKAKGESLYAKYYMQILDEEIEVTGPTNNYTKENGAEIDAAIRAQQAYEDIQADIDYVEENRELWDKPGTPEEISAEEYIQEALDKKALHLDAIKNYYNFPDTEEECQKLYAKICNTDREQANALYDYLELRWPI